VPKDITVKADSTGLKFYGERDKDGEIQEKAA